MKKTIIILSLICPPVYAGQIQDACIQEQSRIYHTQPEYQILHQNFCWCYEYQISLGESRRNAYAYCQEYESWKQENLVPYKKKKVQKKGWRLW